MAYADIGDKAPLDIIDETYLDQIRANFQAGVPDIFTTKGDLAVATAADTAARLAVGTNGGELSPASGEATGLLWYKRPLARLTISGAFDPAVGSWDDVDFDTEDEDTDTLHSTVTNPERITIPAGCGGWYEFHAAATFATGDSANASSAVGVRFLVNGSAAFGTHLINSYRAEAINMSVSTSGIYELSATDYVTCQVFTSRDVNVTAASFSAHWVRPSA